ncbi:MAG: hypothetical protein CVV57_05605 [Tenericutes bacterium HGW-Tenericutes-2]|jgi:hypothetical protein|nr:MAG: hypothetical protein CVV57_05605 [Tenericutes bacterium HGW-Tenericutes-2]
MKKEGKIVLRSVFDNIIAPMIPGNPLYQAIKQISEEKKREQLYNQLVERIENLEEDKITKSNEEILEGLTILHNTVISLNLTNKVEFYINGFYNFSCGSYSIEELDQFYRNLNDLMKIDIDELKKFSEDEKYQVNELSFERLVSRGLIINNVDRDISEHISSVVENIKNAFANDAKHGWEYISNDELEVKYSVSKWGQEFIRFFNL